MDSNKETDVSSKEDGDLSFDFILNTSQLDTSIVKRIGLEVIRSTPYLAVQIRNYTVLQPVDIDDFFKNTITPLKKQLNEILANDKDKKLAIQSSVAGFIYNNLRHIVALHSSLKGKQSDDDDDDEASDLETLYGLATGTAVLHFKDQYMRPYAAVRLISKERGQYMQIIPLESTRYKRYLARIFNISEGKIVGGEIINAVINSLAAAVEFDGPTVPLHMRVAWGNSRNRARDGYIYYDMADEKSCVIEISPDSGWNMLFGADSSMPILFRRHNQVPQAEPSRNYDPDVFDQFIRLTNVRNKKHQLLLKVYVVSLLVPDIDHPILTTYGPKGSAKSFLLELIKKTIDPSVPVLLTLYRDQQQFIQQVNHYYLAYYDNVKFIPYWLSDEICKTVTGIGHTKRKLWTDDDDIIYQHKHCVSINGIQIALTEPDALDRSIFIELLEIDDESHKTEEELFAQFERIKPPLLGCLFDIVSRAMRIKPTLNHIKLSRMADFTLWGEAISQAMGYKPMSFVEAYRENRNEQNIVAVSENIVGSLFVKFFNSYESESRSDQVFAGQPDALHRLLVEFAEQNDININYRQFPKTPEVLVKRLKDIKSNLKEGFNIIVKIERDSRNCSVLTIYRDERVKYQSSAGINQATLLNQTYALQVLHNHLLK